MRRLNREKRGERKGSRGRKEANGRKQKEAKRSEKKRIKAERIKWRRGFQQQNKGRNGAEQCPKRQVISAEFVGWALLLVSCFDCFGQVFWCLAICLLFSSVLFFSLLCVGWLGNERNRTREIKENHHYCSTAQDFISRNTFLAWQEMKGKKQKWGRVLSIKILRVPRGKCGRSG